MELHKQAKQLEEAQLQDESNKTKNNNNKNEEENRRRKTNAKGEDTF